MTSRALRIRRLRQRVAVGAAATFAAAFGTVAASGSMGAEPTTTDTATSTEVDAYDTYDTTTTARAPSAVTTRQS